MTEYTSCFSQSLSASTLQDRLIGYLKSFVCTDDSTSDKDLLCLAMWSVIVYDNDTWRKRKAYDYIEKLYPNLSIEELSSIISSNLSAVQLCELKSLLDYTRVYLEADQQYAHSVLRELLNQTPIAFKDVSNRNQLRTLCAAVSYLVSAHNPALEFSQGYLDIVQEVLGTPEAVLSESVYADLADQGRQYLLNEGMLKPFMLSDVLYQKYFGYVEQYMLDKYK